MCACVCESLREKMCACVFVSLYLFCDDKLQLLLQAASKGGGWYFKVKRVRVEAHRARVMKRLLVLNMWLDVHR